MISSTLPVTDQLIKMMTDKLAELFMPKPLAQKK